MSAPLTPYRRAWLKWKAMKLPWRKKFLVGLDLQGNTFWEFRDTLNPGRMRRIVEYPRSLQYSEVTSKITPAWHQWLRHTRENPPSLTEQSHDLIRQRQLKVLAAEADARWNAKESFLDSPNLNQTQPQLESTSNTSRNVEAGREHPHPSPEEIQRRADTTVGKIGPLERDPERTRVQGGVAARVFTNPGARSRPAAEPKQPLVPPKEEDPWAKAQKGKPTGEWQPQAWTPGGGMAPKRR